MEDEKIITLFFARDEQAIFETASLYGAKLHRLAAQITQDERDAAEILNDTYLRAWNTIPPNKPEYFFAYLAKICRNLCFDRIDQRKAKKRQACLAVLTKEMEECIPAANKILSGVRMQAGVAEEVEAKMEAEQRRHVKLFFRRAARTKPDDFYAPLLVRRFDTGDCAFLWHQ